MTHFQTIMTNEMPNAQVMKKPQWTMRKRRTAMALWICSLVIDHSLVIVI
jgi:hypothetical protein